MPTKTPLTLFDPNLAKAQVRPLTEKSGPLLNEVLRYGLALFARCSYRPAGGDENLVILLTYRHFLEALDSVNVLVEESAPAPAGLLLRTMFEALLTIEYVTQDQGKAQSRAFALLYQVELQRRRFYLQQDPSTPQGKELRSFISNDPYYNDWKPIDVPDLNGRLNEIQKMLDIPDMKQISLEYAKTKKGRGGRPPWYSLFGGPRTVRDLAKLLKRPAAYEFLYREWSERTHSVDAIDRILTHTISGPAVRSLRDATEMNSTIDFAITFAIDTARCLIRYYRPGEEMAFSKWLLQEIMPQWKSLPKLVINPTA